MVTTNCRPPYPAFQKKMNKKKAKELAITETVSAADKCSAMSNWQRQHPMAHATERRRLPKHDASEPTTATKAPPSFIHPTSGCHFAGSFTPQRRRTAGAYACMP
mmetsp:Transcript_57212/g.113708  ORF Transcript_57212/g.113708 Transcript_57212/m.113708 type:complete len:105 (-) Transcript_57212:521-835(-)